MLLDCGEATVFDGPEALCWEIEGPAPHSVALWRNLGGYPPGAPYRSVGLEPMLGRGFDRSDPGAAAVVPATS